MENLTVSFRPEVIDDDIHRVAFEFKLKELLVGVFKVPIARNEQRLIDLSKCTDVDTKYFKMSTEGHISVCVKGPVVFFDAHDDYSELSLSAPLEACRGAFDEMAAHVMKVRVPPEMYYGMVALKAEYEGSWFGVKYLPDHNPQPQCTKSWQISAPSMSADGTICGYIRNGGALVPYVAFQVVEEKLHVTEEFYMFNGERRGGDCFVFDLAPCKQAYDEILQIAGRPDVLHIVK